MSTRIAAFAEADLHARRDDIVEVYREAFTPPPYNKAATEVEELAYSFPTQWQREAYRFVAALEGGSDQLVGFAYGYASTASRWWGDFAKAALGDHAG